MDGKRMTGNSPTIVVVDDSPTVKALFERGIIDCQIELKVFRSADNAWTYLEAISPALLFLNIKMPGKDGLTFLKELRHLPLHKETSVVMISSKDYAQDRSVAEKLGALEFITKPMPIQVITDVIHKYLQPTKTT
ncbi:MAG: response regulator [Gammaproteobacteria bacterium]|jgi:DNA-binding response OmpR family regulator|nr:response regulator [Gammaproteobacteria bacterium]